MHFTFLKSTILVTCFLVLMTFLNSAFAETNVNSTDNTTVSSLSSEQIKSLITELKYYDEVLTSSVLSYAFSGETKWLDRYNEYESKLTQLIDDSLTPASIAC